MRRLMLLVMPDEGGAPFARHDGKNAAFAACVAEHAASACHNTMAANHRPVVPA